MATILYTIAAISISAWVGSMFNTPIFGIICFWFFLPGYKLVLAIDAAFFVYSDHHKRNDRRAAKMMESQRFITQEQTDQIIKDEVWDRCRRTNDFTEWDEKYGTKKVELIK